MRIFIIARGFPSDQQPQWGCFEKDQAEALVKQGHDVIMISVDSRFGIRNREYGLSVLEKDNIKSVNLFLIPGVLMDFNQRFKLWVKTQELDYVYKKAVSLYGEPDVLYSHYLFLTEIAVNIAKRHNKPIVAIEHWTELNKTPLSPNVENRARRAYTDVTKLITVCCPLKDNIKRLLGFDSIVVYNMVNKLFLNNRVFQHHNKKIKFITVGTLHKNKGHDILIEAFAKSALPKDAWQMTIIGEGKERNTLQNLINSLGLGDNIFLVGKRDKTNVKDSLLESDVFVMPSRTENFSVAVLEALACGLPVIASICGGIRECIDESNGVLFPVGDVESLSKNLVFMSNNYEQYDKQLIADNCYSRFSPETIGKDLSTIFEEVILKYNK